MPHQVQFSDSTFIRLQQLAVPLVDTIETVVIKLLDAYEHQRSGSPAPQPPQIGAQPRRFSNISPPDLTHTKVLSAKVAGTALRKATWNALLFEMARRTKDQLASGQDATRLFVVNFVAGEKADEGYRYIPEAAVSIQGQDANSAWRGASHLAQQLRVPVEVEFLWRAKEGAAYPGTTGRLIA